MMYRWVWILWSNIKSNWIWKTVLSSQVETRLLWRSPSRVWGHERLCCKETIYLNCGVKKTSNGKSARIWSALQDRSLESDAFTKQKTMDTHYRREANLGVSVKRIHEQVGRKNKLGRCQNYSSSGIQAGDRVWLHKPIWKNGIFGKSAKLQKSWDQNQN